MMRTFAQLGRSRADRVGTCLSVLCAIHCMATPLLGTTLTLAGMGFWMLDSIESLLLMASVGLAAASLCWGFQRHRQRRVFLFLATALGLIAVGRFGVESPYETVLVVAGAATLATGHLVNRHPCGTCASRECGESDRQP